MGDSKTSMLISLTMNTINVGGNALLIYVFNMWLAGDRFLASRAAVIITLLLCNPHRTICYDRLRDPSCTGR